jgi:hypothetical protein
MGNKKEEPMENKKSQPSKARKESLYQSLIGQIIDPSRIEIGWSFDEQFDGYSIVGTVIRRERLRGQQLLEYGVFDIGSSGMPVVLRTTVSTDKEHKITSIDIDAYASNGPAYGRPIYVAVTDSDENEVAAEVARFLAEPQLESGKIVEDKKWLEEAIARFHEMSQDIFMMGKELPRYYGKPVSFAKARKNGWIVDVIERKCFGHFELITDCEGMSFWLGVLIETDDEQEVSNLKCVLSEDGPPTMEQAEEFFEHEMVEGFNFARLTRVLDAVIHA